MLAASREARADASEIHRGADEGLAHAGAVSVVEAADALLVGITDGGKGLTAIGEAGCEDVARADRATVDDLLFVNQLEFVAVADVEREVDVVAEDVCQIHRQRV